MSEKPTYEELEKRVQELEQERSKSKQVEEELRKSQQVIKGILNSIPVRVFWKDQDLIFLGCNVLFANDAGFADPKDIIGKDDYQMVWRDHAESYRNDDREVIESGVSKLLIEEPQTTPKGKTITLLTSKIPLLSSKGEINGVLGTYMDITDLKMAEQKIQMKTDELKTKQQELIKSEALFRGFFDNMTSGAAIYEVINEGRKGSDYINRGFNNTSLKLERKSLDQVIGKSLYDLRPNIDDYGLIPILRKVWQTGESAYFPTKIYQDENFSNYYENYIFKLPTGEVVAIYNDVTAQKNAETALNHAKERFELAMKFANDGLFDWNIKTNEIYYSPVWKSLLGYRDEEIKNEFSEWERLTRHEDVKASWAMLKDLLEGRRDKFEMEFQMLHKDGHYVDILSRASAIFDESGEAIRVVGTHVDITERKKAEKELIQQKQTAERYLNLAGVIFIGLDLDGKVNLTNRQACTILECNRNDIIGMDWFDNFIPLNIRDNVRSVFKQLVSGEVEPDEYYENSVISKGGKEKIIAWHNTYIKDDSEKIIGILGSGEDITDRKALQTQLQKLQKMESIGNLAGGIAHDFNNLLFPIIGLSEMLLEDLPQNSPDHENVQEILKAGKRGSELVKQILAFSRQSEHKKIPVRIQQILKEVYKLCRSTIPSDIEISIDIQPDCGLVMADSTQLHQVAMNLITNAYHALNQPEGKIAIQLKGTRLEANDLIGSPLQPGSYAMLKISDSGSGIDPAIMDKIFEPYFTTKERGKGTGLGLAVVYGIAREHGGDVQVSGELEKGTTFTVFIPLLTEQPAKIDSAEIPDILQRGNERVLVVDDEGPIAKLEKQMLERLGYQVKIRISSLDALEAFRDAPDAFDIVITDMAMPNMTGDQLARELIAIRPDIPIIICTGFSERTNPEKAAAIGVKGFLMKPIVKSMMADMVRKVLDGVKGKSQQ
jgi:PAS domain S-box-containing protein